MNVQPMIHLTPAQLADLALGKLDDAQLKSVQCHLEKCAACRQAAAEVPPDSFVKLVRSAKSPVSVSTPTPLPPVTQGLPEIKAGPKDTSGVAPPGLPLELAGHAKFHILRELGRGGMGVVYQAEHRLMKRPVAIKVLNPRLLDNPASLARFHQEVEAAAQLAHPNIVTSHDAEQAGDLHMLVMEYVEGQSLAQVLERQGPLPIVHACQYVGQAACGLALAHDLKMIHRDIKPQNLMLTPQGVVKILDFGLARIAERPREKGLTQESVVMGTPEYIAPEQATDARQADIRSDIYSLGCTLYCLLSGHPPFQGETAMQTIRAHAEQEAPSLRQLRPEVPVELAAIVTKMIAKKPADRYQTPAEVMAALAPFSKPVGQTFPSARQTGMSAPRGKRRLLAVLALVAVLGVGGWLLAPTIFKVKTPEGTIVLKIDQPGAEVFVDDKAINIRIPGDNQPVEIKLEPGKRMLRISKDGFVAVTREIELKMGKAEPIQIRLEPVQSAATQAGARFTNSLGMEFALIPKGKAWLGGGGGKPGDKEVEIKNDFYLGVYEVTQGEWEKVMGDNPSAFTPVPGQGKDSPRYIAVEDQKRFPVEGVTWGECQKFLQRLNAQAKDAQWVYRLPTETEWEYACRGGPLANKAESGFDYYFDEPTNQLLPGQANFKHAQGLPRTNKVGSYRPNRLGLFDMHGNVTEWCDDFVQSEFNPAHAVRSGSWVSDARGCRATSRGSGILSHLMWDVGLRVARVPIGKDSKQGTLLPHHRPGWVEEKWLREVAVLPAEQQVAAVKAMMPQRNPGFEGTIKHQTANGVVTEIQFDGTAVQDLSPLLVLAGLQTLDCSCQDPWQSPLADLSPLACLPLRSLRYPYHTWLGAEQLRSIQTLETINDQPTAAFWKKVDGEAAEAEIFRKMVAGLNPAAQEKAVAQRFKERNPGFDGKLGAKLKDGVIVGLQFPTDAVVDLSPVRAFPGLQALKLGTNSGKGKLADLTPLQGVKLTILHLDGCAQVQDLTPLQGMPLTFLSVGGSELRDLTPLRGMKLTRLNLYNCQQLRELTPLQGMPLTTLYLDGCGQVQNLTPLQGMKLTTLSLIGCGQVRDLTALEGMSLEWIRFTPKNITKGIDDIRRMTSLKKISVSADWKQYFSPEEFWKKYDAGEFSK